MLSLWKSWSFRVGYVQELTTDEPKAPEGVGSYLKHLLVGFDQNVAKRAERRSRTSDVLLSTVTYRRRATLAVRGE